MENIELKKFLKTDPNYKIFKKKDFTNINIFYISYCEENDTNGGIDFVYYDRKKRDKDFDLMFF